MTHVLNILILSGIAGIALVALYAFVKGAVKLQTFIDDKYGMKAGHRFFCCALATLLVGSITISYFATL